MQEIIYIANSLRVGVGGGGHCILGYVPVKTSLRLEYLLRKGEELLSCKNGKY